MPRCWRPWRWARRCSRAAATALPEVVGDAGLLLDPDDPAVWAAAISDGARRRRAQDPPRRRGAGAGGRAHDQALSAGPGARLPLGARRATVRGSTRGRPTLRSMKLTVLCPHFAPDPAPTGEVMTRIVAELADRGHEIHVVTALPWYTHHAIEEGWRRSSGPAGADDVGLHHPGPPVPVGQDEHRAAIGVLRRLLGPVRCGRAAGRQDGRGAGHVAAVDHRTRGVGRGDASTDAPWSSTCRTCSPTSPSSSAS